MTPHHDGSGLYVSHDAPALGDTVTLFVRTVAADGVRRLWARTTPDGEPRFDRAVVDRRVSPFAGGPVETWWRVDVEVRNPLTRYRFLLDGPGGYRWLTAAGVVGHDVPDATDFRLVAFAPPPAWSADAVVYQIFPDRFARSGPVREAPSWAIPCEWDTPVIGRGPETPRQWYGGDLDGIAAHLDHVADLGANTVYLTPIFPSRSNHRYDATSFEHVDPVLGGDTALGRLADAVHARGWRLVGDLTTNHTGVGHPWFAADRDELYYVDPSLPHGYEAWAGVPSLPKLDWGSDELRSRMGRTVRHWLDRLDGWRIDVANMTGRRGADDHTHAAAAYLRAEALAARADALLVAEHGHDATGDLDADGWHGTMNYAGFTRPLWTWMCRPEIPFLGVPVSTPRLGGAAVVDTMRAFAARMSWRSLTTSWNLLGSHDTPRFRTVTGSADLVEVGAGLLATMPGVPMVFAGDEWGLEGTNGEDARRPMPWDGPADKLTYDRYRSLLRLRRSSDALRHGGLRWVHAGEDALVYLRETAAERLLILAARAPGAPSTLPGVGAGTNVYGGAPDLAPGRGGGVPLAVDGPTFQAWRLDGH